MRSFRVPAVLLATLYVACADPPKKIIHKGSAGTAGAISDGEAGARDDGGSSATSGTGGGGKGGGGTGGGKGGSGPTAEAGMGGEGGVSEADGGEGGVPDTVGGGGGGGGSGGAPPVNSCGSVGARSKLPVPSTSGFAKPSGTVGGFRVINWAGFKGAISFTFDDAVKSQRDHYAELNQVGVPMTFYLVSANDASSPVWTTAANDGHELGNHSAHHCSANGTNCAWGAFTNVDSEMDDCTAHIKTTFGVQGVYTFAAPNGDGNWGIPASTRFMLNRGISDAPGGVLPNDSTDPFNLPCHMAATGETASGGFNSVTDSVRTNGSWRIILSHSLEMDGTWQPVLASEVVAAMTYAKGLGDVWTDTMVSIGAYWRGQKALSTVQPVTTGTDKVYSWTLPAHFPPGRYLRVSVTGGKVTQCGTELTWDDHGYYEVSLDAGSLTISP